MARLLTWGTCWQGANKEEPEGEHFLAAWMDYAFILST